jgi:predicted nucleotidyltransferase
VTHGKRPEYMMDDKLRQNLTEVVGSFPDIKLVVLFGSLAKDMGRPDSDLDIAVAGLRPLPTALRLRLIEKLGASLGRPVDLIDLKTAGYFVMQQALIHGEIVFCKDRSILADIGKRLVFEREDFAPYVRRTLRERRRVWIAS